MPLIADSITTNWSPSTPRHRMHIINKQITIAVKKFKILNVQNKTQREIESEREKYL